MTDRNILIIKTTWSYTITQPELTGELFYEKLFELNPSLKLMFPSNMEQQVKKLIDMITYMVTHLQTMEGIQKDIDAMAVRHAGYGVRKEHYQNVGDALIWVLENRLEDLWSDESRIAWTNLYTLWSNSMMLASEGYEDK